MTLTTAEKRHAAAGPLIDKAQAAMRAHDYEYAARCFRRAMIVVQGDPHACQYRRAAEEAERKQRERTVGL